MWTKGLRDLESGALDIDELKLGNGEEGLRDLERGRLGEWDSED